MEETAREELVRALEALPDGVWLADAGTKDFLAGNQKICQMLGYSQEELRNLGIRDIHPEEDLRRVLETFEKQASGEIKVATLPVKRKDGTVFQADVSTNLITTAGRTYLMGIFKDASERIQMEKALGASEESYRTLYESSKDGIAFFDVEGKIVDANRAFLDMLGYSAEEVRELTDRQLTPPKWHEADKAIKEQLQKRGSSDEYEKEYVRKDGTVFPISTRAWVIRDEEGEPVRMWAIVSDITERKRMEEALRESRDRYRSLVAASKQIVWTTNAKGEVEADIPTWREFTGQTAEAVRGLGWLQAVHSDDRDRVVAGWKEAVAAKRPYETEYHLRKRDGSYRHLLARGIPVIGEGGRVREWVGTCTDITELKQMEGALEKQTKQMKEELGKQAKKMEEALAKQAKELQERDKAVGKLAAPLVDVWGGIVVVPLSGALDPDRVKRLTESLLEHIAQVRADIIVMDISGIATIDAETAGQVLRAVEAVRLVGSDVIITGIGPEVATTLVDLEVDLSGIITRSTLPEGLDLAYIILGWEVTESST